MPMPRPERTRPDIQHEDLIEPQVYDLDADHESRGKTVHDSKYSYSSIGSVPGDVYDDDDNQQMTTDYRIDPRSAPFPEYYKPKGKEIPILTGGFQMTKELPESRGRGAYGWPSMQRIPQDKCCKTLCC